MTKITDVIRLQVYVEGLLLPNGTWSNVRVISRDQGSATASMTLFAHPDLRIEEWARARVQIFWSDIDIRARHGDDWPMLFDGEISADGFSKSPTSRHVSVSMVGQDVYFDQCKLYYYNLAAAANVMNGERLAMLFGNNSVEINVANPGLDTVNRIVETIRGVTRDKPNAPLPSLVREVFKSMLSSNFFFERTRTQIKLDERFAVPKDDFAALLYSKRELFFTQIENGVTVRNGDTPMRQVLEEVLAVFRYQMICNPQPTMIKGELADLDPIVAQRESALASAETLCRSLFGVPPEKIAIDAQTTDNQIALIADGLANPVQRANLYLGAVLSDEAVTLLNDDQTTNADIVVYMDKIRPRIRDSLKLVRAELQRANAPQTTKSGVDVLDEDTKTSDHIAQFLLLPDTTFAAVPRCNIIFPNEYSTYEMQRNHLVEPTRMIQFVPTVADAESQVFYAPANLANDARRVVDPITYTGNFKTFPPVIVQGGIQTVIGSRFGPRIDPKAKAQDNQNVASSPKKNHKGIDIRVAKGTPVFAVMEGSAATVAIQKEGAGLHVVLLHAGNSYTKYFHLSSVAVKTGDKVTAGQQIGLSGGDPKDTDTAGRTTGPHLHFEWCPGARDNQQDPEPLLIAAQNDLDKSVSKSSVISKSAAVDVEPEMSQTMADAGDAVSDKPFGDYQYLTPEEEIRGIVAAIDTSMDRTATIYALAGGIGSRDNYLQMITQSNFYIRRYQSRSFGGSPMSWTPRIVAGLPSLILDGARPVIAKVTQVIHDYSVGGQATTNVSYDAPRFWDEGDPYFWRDGKEAFLTVSEQEDNDNDGAKQPDPASANFPGFMLPSLFSTNSYQQPLKTTTEPFGGNNQNRPEDSLYLSMIGCRSVPYAFAERVSPVTGAKVAFNAAVPNILKHYQALASVSHEAANDFIESYTARTSVRRDEFYAFLGCVPGAGGYTGPAFRASIRNVILDYVAKSASADAFRG